MSIEMQTAAPAGPRNGGMEADRDMTQSLYSTFDSGTNDFRDFIADTLAMARIQAELGERYADIGDDAGLEYTLRRLVAYTRAALSTFNDLREEKMRGASA